MAASTKPTFESLTSPTSSQELIMEQYYNSISLQSLQGANAHIFTKNWKQLAPMWTWFESLQYDDQHNVLRRVLPYYVSNEMFVGSVVHGCTMDNYVASIAFVGNGP